PERGQGMIEIHEVDIDRITEVLAHVLNGGRPQVIPLPEDRPDNELRQVVDYLNRFLASYDDTAELAYQLSRGELGADPPRGSTVVLQSLKSLYASLRTLTWTTQQIAKGDFSQKVSFMGEFSEAFNSMAEQLRDAFAERVRAAETLQQQVEELARTRRAMLNIMEDLKTSRPGSTAPSC
ncbi:MAG TPA: HAMP domain-containing protein, partial [Holophaga sp.]|nr:HAMP domain-containing protein [Holophaga sp.]